MPDPTIGGVAKGLNYLQSAIKYLVPVLRICEESEPGTGSLIISREVFAHIDFLGALYCGYRNEDGQAGRRTIATSQKAIRFIVEIFGSFDENYRKYGELAYTMVRHGTIHVH